MAAQGKETMLRESKKIEWNGTIDRQVELKYRNKFGYRE